MDEKVLNKGKVLYVDPNNSRNINIGGSTIDSIFNGEELMKEPEDLTVAVDLEVITKSRRNITHGDNEMNNITVATMVDARKKVNFLGGQEIGDSKVLTTYFTDIKYDENINDTLEEAMSISSIDIEFNSWYVANVNIKFVDVRGASLFSPTEHNYSNSRIDNNRRINKDSPYYAFFTMPYPMFNLKVKGIYGDAVNYPLHLVDFKSTFNNETGNFEMDANFIGYTYAILNDIQMNYLIAAPYADMYGESYWNTQVNNGRFRTLEGNPLPRIPEIIDKIVDGEYIMEKMSQTNNSVIEMNDFKNKLGYIDNIINSLDFYKNIIKNSSDGEEILKIRNDVISKIFNFKETFNSDIIFNKYVVKDEVENNEIDIEIYLTPNSEGKLDIHELENDITNYKIIISNKLDDLTEEVNKLTISNLKYTYGIEPTIYNFTKTLIAHMETLLHIIGKAAVNVGDGSDRVLRGGHETDLKDNKLSPFPWLTINKKDAWLGDYYPNFNEVKLVNSIHRAKTNISDNINKSIERLASGDGIDDEILNSNVTTGDVWLPMNAFDNSISDFNNPNHPYDYIKIDDVTNRDIKLTLSARTTMLLGLTMFRPITSSGEIDTHIKYLAKAEALNIIDSIGHSRAHISRVQGIIEEMITGLNIDVQQLKTKRYSTYNDVFLSRIGFSCSDTTDVLPLTSGKISKISDGNGNINPLIRKYDNITYDNNYLIIEGKDNCDIIKNNWYTPVKHKAETNDLSFIINNYKFDNDMKFNVISNNIKNDTLLPKTQPMVNRVGLVSKYSDLISNGIWDDGLNWGISDGYKNFNEAFNDNKLYQKYQIDNYAINNVILSDGNGILDLKNTLLKEDELSTDIFNYPIVGGVIRFASKLDRFTGTGETKEKNIIEKPFSLFGHSLYYKQNEHTNKLLINKAKAYLFLHTLPINDKYIMDNISNMYNTNKSFINKLSKVELLYLGSLLWRYKTNGVLLTDELKVYDLGGDTTKTNELYSKNDLIKYNGNFTLSYIMNDNSTAHKGVVKKINDIIWGDIRNKLINYFEEWSEDNEGWLRIKNTHELTYNNSNLTSIALHNNIENINNELNSNGIIKTPSEFEITWYKFNTNNTSGRGKTFINKQLDIIYKDKSEQTKLILELLTEEVLFASVGNANIFSENGIDNESRNSGFSPYFKTKYIRNYLNNLRDNINEHRLSNKTYEYKEEDGTIGATYIDNREINIQTYRYLKNLYDKWVSGYEYDSPNSEYKWIDTKEMVNIAGYNTYDFINFKFIDRSYNNVGHKYHLDMRNMVDNLIGLNEQKTLYSTIAQMLSSNDFTFIPMPNYQSWNKPGDFLRVFEPIPYNESNINSGDMNVHIPMFICMYTGELAKRLDSNLINNDFKDDSLNLNPSDDIQSDFYDEKDTSKYLNKVPVFAVSYGKQNQQYFKKISLNQNNPATTEVSVKAIERLVENSDKASSIEVVTQDLYNLYSNYSYLCEIEMLGTPQIQPMMYFQLTNIPMWSGAYLIYKVRHSITPGMMTTNITGMKMSINYPDFVTPKTITYDNFNFSNEGLSMPMTPINFNETLGKFKLGDYFGNKNDIEAPIKYINRIKYHVSPLIERIYSDWMKENNNGFVINSGYRSPSYNKAEGGSNSSAHMFGLASDIQILNQTSGTDNNLNYQLFNFIKNKMESGHYKIDQLIMEYKDKNTGGWVHIGVAIESGGRLIQRGMCYEQNTNSRSEILVIDNATNNNFIENENYIYDGNSYNLFVNYWKDAENSILLGYNKQNKTWTSYNDNGEAAIAWGLRVKGMYTTFTSAEQSKDIEKLTVSNKRVETELKHRIDKTMLSLNSKFKSDRRWDNVKELYKYTLVDIALNVGNINEYPKLQEAVLSNDKEGIMREWATSGDTNRNQERKNLIKLYG